MRRAILHFPGWESMGLQVDEIQPLLSKREQGYKKYLIYLVMIGMQIQVSTRETYS